MTTIRQAARRIRGKLGWLANILRRSDRHLVASTYLKGSGIEIGALHNPLKVPANVRVQYVDRMPVEELLRQYPELASQPLTPVDILDDGETLSTISDESQDFVIANHFLEHCENPLKALTNMVRVLKGDGILYLAIPDKRYTFDRNRPITPFSHLLSDYLQGPAGSRRGAYEEWVRLVEKESSEERLRVRAKQLEEMNYSIHFHVWTQSQILEIVRNLTDELHLPVELLLFLKNGEECVVILGKTI